jgi:hypothetical protein
MSLGGWPGTVVKVWWSEKHGRWSYKIRWHRRGDVSVGSGPAHVIARESSLKPGAVEANYER